MEGTGTHVEPVLFIGIVYCYCLLLLFVCSCYGAENDEQKCCNTCEEVREAYRKKGWAISNPKVRERHGYIV